MAIYVYKTTGGTLQSWIPENLTIVEAQAKGQLASDAALATARCTAVDNLPPLDATHAWDATQKTVVVVPAPKPIMATADFILLFTDPEFAGVQKAAVVGDATYNARISKFNSFINTATRVNLGDPFVVGVVGTSMVNQGILTVAEANRILSGTPF